MLLWANSLKWFVKTAVQSYCRVIGEMMGKSTINVSEGWEN